MNKMKKLLSVVLAVVLAFLALSVLGSAAVTQYKTVADLEALDAYSPYGQVTRLSTEERASIVQDFLDSVLPGLGINMGEVFNVLGLSITLDLSNIDRLCYSLDTVKSTMNNTLFGIAAGIVNLGILEQLKMDTWNTGIDRAGDSQITLFAEFFELLSNNSGLVYNVLSSGNLDLGIIGGFLGGVDLSAVTNIIGDLPGLLKGLVFGIFERWDDTTAEIQALEDAKKGNGKLEATVNTFVQNLFKNDMSLSTVKADVTGKTTSKHNLPSSGHRVIYSQETTGTNLVLVSKSYATQAYVDAQAKLGNTVAVGSYYVSAKYVLEPEVGTSDYIWHQVNLDEDGNMKTLEDGSFDYVGGETPNLKYYELDSKLLPEFDENIDLSTMSAGDLLYTFIPYLFNDMAPVVLNGSVKKILAEFFGAKFTYVGDVGSDAVNALPDSDNAIFTEEQGDYMFEWSDYAVINGNHYYRYLDQIYAGDISNKNNYFDIVNWDYEITGDFIKEFIPTDDADANNRFLKNINNFLIKVATTVFKASAETADSASDYTATWTMPAFVTGGNENLVNNIKMAAQAVISLAPQHIFGSDYAENERCYYELLMSDKNETVLTGIAAQLVDIIMPSMTLPGVSALVESQATVGSILAAALREFAAYLIPEYNFDALIYADFGTTAADKEKTFVSGKDNNYWLDVILTMGINIGFEYIRAFADMGEGTAEWAAFVAYSGYKVDGGAYAAGMTGEALRAHWEGMLDYVVDWALDKDYEWTWKMENLVEVDGLTIDMTTAQDPWTKLDKILFGIIPFDEILTVKTNDEYATRLEKFLRYDLILGLIELRWGDLLNTIELNGANQYFRTANVLDQLAKLLKSIVNGLLDKIGGGDFALIPAAVTDFDSLLNQGNIATLARDLIARLITAYNNGLLDTALPFFNFFIGWKTDAQKYAEPQVWTSYRDGNDYMYVSGNTIANTSIFFQNNSSGMLEIHRNSNVTDHEYAIQIVGIEDDAKLTDLTYSYGDGYVSPYEQLTINVGGTYGGEEPVTITIAYEYVGKDGKPVGATYYTSFTTLISNKFEDSKVRTEDKGVGSGITWNTRTNAYNKFIFAEDIYTAINDAVVQVGYKNSITGSTPRGDYQAPALVDSGEKDGCNIIWVPEAFPATDEYAETYFTHKTLEESGWPSEISANLGSWSSGQGGFYKNKAEYGADYEFPYGVYDFPRQVVAYDGQHVFDQAFIHYDDYDVYEMYTEYAGKGITKYDVIRTDAAAVAAYDAYNAAFKEVTRLALYPMMTKLNGNGSVDYVEVIMPQIEPAKEALEVAYEELVPYLEAAQGAVASATRPSFIDALEVQLLTDDNATGKEINFQDYEFYEYFNYADLRTIGRNMVAEYEVPEIMDTYYIMGSGIREAELNEVIAAEDNAFIAAGIEASKVMNDEAAIAASLEAYNNWKMPTYGQLNVEDLTSRIAYYKQFVIKEDADHMYFLNQEIAHVEAQGLVAEDYEAVTWGRYADALAEAKAVSAGEDEYADLNSRIYDAKYNLMVAYKQLLHNDDSLIKAGGTGELLGNIEIANEIFASLAAGDGAWTLKEGVDADEAYAALIQALGYYYEGEDGYTYNLFADSALEYADNDRPNKTANQAKVNAANAALVAAMDNFVAAEPEEPAEPNTLVLNENAPFEAYIDYDNNIGGEYTGTIYGFDTLGWNDNWEVDGAIADFVTTAYGDDYLEVIVPDCGVETTGTIVNVLDDEGNVVESYVYIYFGDMDMDGEVGESDAGMASYYEMWYDGIDSLDVFMAGDLDADTMPGESDAGVMSYWSMWYEGLPTQADVGANVYGCIVYEIY